MKSRFEGMAGIIVLWQKIGLIIPTDKITAILCLNYVDENESKLSHSKIDRPQKSHLQKKFWQKNLGWVVNFDRSTATLTISHHLPNFFWGLPNPRAY